MSIKKTGEGGILKVILEYLKLNGWMAWRNNTGARPMGSDGKRFVRFGHKGSGDILALKDGVFLSLECKQPGKYPTAEQRQWIDEINRHGGVAAVVRSLEDLLAVLEQINA